MTVSAMYQQWPMDNEKLAGSYPDSWGQWFTRRNPTYINPEDIAVNLLALKGLDPGLRSVAVNFGGGLVHITAPSDIQTKIAGRYLQVEMKYTPGEIFYATLAPVALEEGASFLVVDYGLPRRERLGAGDVGWAYDPQSRIVAVGMKADPHGAGHLIVSGISYSAPVAQKPKTEWEFQNDTEGWSAAHACKMEAKDGRLVITVTGHDPYALSGAAAIDADVHKQLKMRVRLTGGNSVGLFWRSSRSTAWGPDKNITVPVPADGQTSASSVEPWREITFDLSKHPLWTGKILALRLDPEPADLPAGTTLEVDWIRPVR
jgi:hypothetical protein